MLRPLRRYYICSALRTLVTNHSSHGHFPRFCVLKLPARHCKAVTRGTPKAQHRQAAGAGAQAVIIDWTYRDTQNRESTSSEHN